MLIICSLRNAHVFSDFWVSFCFLWTARKFNSQRVSITARIPNCWNKFWWCKLKELHLAFRIDLALYLIHWMMFRTTREASDFRIVWKHFFLNYCSCRRSLFFQKPVVTVGDKSATLLCTQWFHVSYRHDSNVIAIETQWQSVLNSVLKRVM